MSTAPELAAAEPADSDALGFRDALATGGTRTVAILGGLALFDEFDNAILGIFAPERAGANSSGCSAALTGVTSTTNPIPRFANWA